MADTNLQVRFKHPYKTEAEWEATTTIPKAGEALYTSGGLRHGWMKLGNGTDLWKDLPYIKPTYDYSEIQPLKKQTYTNVYCSSNSDPAGYLYFATVKPENYNKSWRISYRLKATINGISNGYQYSEVTIDGVRNTYAAYKTYNAINNTSYRPLYSHVYHAATETGLNNNYNHLLGFRFQSSYNPHVAANSRIIEIEILEEENCTLTFLDSMTLFADMPGANTTNYGNTANGVNATRVAFDGTTQGYSVSGDRNTYPYFTTAYYTKPLAGTNGIKQYSLIMEDSSGNYQSFTTDYGTGTSKTKNTTGFKLGKLYYADTSSNWASGSRYGNDVTRAFQYGVDARYSFNCGQTLTAYAPIYLVGTYNNASGLFYLDDTWYTQTLPTTEDGKIYIYLGFTYSNYTFDFVGYSTPLWFKDGAIRPFVANEATSSVAGLMSAEDKDKLDTFTMGTATMPAGVGKAVGWYRIAKIGNDAAGYPNFSLYITGGWASGSPTIGEFNISVRDAGARITQISAITGQVVSKIRLIRIGTTGGNYFVDVYQNFAYNSSQYMSEQVFKFIGHGVLNTYDPEAPLTGDDANATATVELTLRDNGMVAPNFYGNATSATTATTAVTATNLDTSVASSAGDRPIWMSWINSNNKRATYDNDFTYDSSTDTLKVKRIDSPELTGTPKAPTAASGTNSAQIATTAFVQNAVGNAEIGGRNLVKDSYLPVSYGVATNQYFYRSWNLYELPYAVNDEFVASADIDVIAGNVTSVTFYLYNTTDGGCSNTCTGEIINGRASATIKVTKAATKDLTLLIYCGLAGATKDNNITVSKVKLERGNKPTDWTPAPEDLVSDITLSGSTLSYKNSVGTQLGSYTLSKTNVGLGNVDNTSDANKPISTATQNALDQLSAKVGNAKQFTGTCSSAANATAKVVTCTAFTADDLVKGTRISVYFDNTNTGARENLTLNVNNTGAKSIRFIYNGSYTIIPDGGYIKAGQIYNFTYDGTYWVVDMMQNSNTYPEYLHYRNNTYAKKAIAANRWIVGDKDGYEEIASGVTFDLSYPILYTTGAISQGGSNYANMLMQYFDLNLGNLKSGFTSSAKKMIYLVVTISGNTATVDPSIITDTLPTSDDGKAYITLGRLGNQSSGANYFLFQAVHPIFAYRKGQVRLYSGSADVVNGHTVEADVPSNAVFTDTKVTQTLYSQNYDLPLLMSYFANTNTGASGTNIALRNNSIYANPSTGLLTATALKSNNYLQIKNQGINVASTYSSSQVDEIILYTGIKFVSSNLMPIVHITGFAYNSSCPIDLSIVFYIYSDELCMQGVVDNGGWHPNVYLFKYTKNSTEYVAIALRASSFIYYPTVSADVINESLGKLTNIDLSLFEFQFTAKDAASVIPEPDNGVTCIQVPYKTNYNPKPTLTVQLNSTTLNSYDGTEGKTINVTKAGLGLGNVENKSSATIRGELTSSNVTTALGYTPANGANYLPLTGGTMTGSIKWSNSTALPEATSTSYLLTIDGFANGGTQKWINVTNVSVGSATKATTADEAKALITLGDNRSVATAPNDYKNKIVFVGLKNKATVNNPSNDTYSYIVGLRGWADSSGGKAHEIAFNDTGIFTRMGVTTEWESWRRLLDSVNYSSYALPLTGGTLSGNLLFNQDVRWSRFPAHYYHNLYSDTDGTVYVHYYIPGTSHTNTKAEFRVKSGDTYKRLTFSGDGSFYWDTQAVLHAGNYMNYALPLSGGTLTGDLTLSVSSGNSPAIIFQRGSLTDSLNDWEIRDKGGLLYFGQRGSSSTAFDTNIYLDNAGGIHATTFSGSLTGHASLDLPLTAGSSVPLSNSLYITRAGECGVEVNNTQSTNPNQVAFIVGSSGYGGIYSRKHNKWIVYADSNGSVTLNGNAVTASSASTATIANYLSIVAQNEIRFAAKPSSATTLYVGYKWHDGTSDAKINRYKFCNGNGVATEVEASTFYGALTGNVTGNVTGTASGNVPLKSSPSDLNTIYDTSVTNITGSLTNGPTTYGYGEVFTMAYRKPSGNTTPDYAAQIYMHYNASTTKNTMYYRTSSQTAWNAWQQVAHAAPQTALGSVTQPIYMESDGTLKVASQVAELDSNGLILSSQLPSYVDDVIEAYYYNNKMYKESAHTNQLTGESSKIYVDLSTNKTYRWSGSAYVEISASLALGENSSSAYRGDRGKIAYDHSQLTSGNPHNVTKTDIGLSNVENKSSATIRGELTSSNVTTALGYTPVPNTRQINGKALTDNIVLDYSDISPIGGGTKTYAGLYGSANNMESTSFYFASVKPDQYHGVWKVKYRIKVDVPNQNYYHGYADVEIYGYENSYVAYSIFNSHLSTSYRTFYYHNLYRATEVGASAYGHLLGISFLYSANSVSSSYPRTVRVDILEAENCTVTMFEDALKYADVPGTGSTNYAGLTSFDGANQGLQETGDYNDTYTVRDYYTRLTAGTNGMKQYSLVMQDADGNWQSFTTDHGTDTTKTRNTTGFQLGKIYYLASSSNYASGAQNGDNIVTSHGIALNFRYSSNCGATLTPYQPLYIKGTYDIATGLFYLADTWWTQELPTSADGFIYKQIGYARTTEQFEFSNTLPTYWYHNGAIREFVMPEATASVAGIMSASDKTKLNGVTFNNGNYTIETGNLDVGGRVTVTTGVGTNGKTQAADGKTGVWLNNAGNAFLVGPANGGSYIYFYYNQATTATSYIHESASGTLKLYNDVSVNHALYVTANTYVTGGLGTGGRTAYNDTDHFGCWLATNGEVHLASSATSGGAISFHYNKSASVTSYIKETASGRLKVSDELYTGGHIAIDTNAKYIYSKFNDNTNRILCGVNANNEILFGYGSFKDQIGSTHLEGNTVSIASRGSIYLQPSNTTWLTVSAGNAVISTSAGTGVYFKVKNSHHEGSLYASDSSTGNFGLYSNTLGKWVIYTQNGNGYLYLPTIAPSSTTSGGAGNLFISTSGRVTAAANSSKRYKHDIQPLTDYQKVLDIPVVSFKYNEGYLVEGDCYEGLDVPGLIAEDVAQYYPIAAIYDNNRVENWNIRHIVPAMLAVEQDHEKQIQKLIKQVEQLSQENEQLKQRIEAMA